MHHGVIGELLSTLQDRFSLVFLIQIAQRCSFAFPVLIPATSSPEIESHISVISFRDCKLSFQVAA